jgi:HK97 family phage portal protein
MREWLLRAMAGFGAEDAHAPTYATQADFVQHALRMPANGWYEPLPPGAAGNVGTVDRCLQLTAQQLAVMPLRYRHAEEVEGYERRWVTNPDPAWYPNGIKSAIFAAIWSMYAHGDAFFWVTSRYADGYPQSWSLLDAVSMHVEQEGGQRRYRSGDTWLRSEDVLQVSRNPTGALRGTGALAAYAPNVASAYQAEAYAADVYASTGVNRVALKSSRRLDSAQAEDLQAQWVAAVSRRLGAPAILPPDLELLQSLTIPPRDMMLLESREWDAKQIAAAFGVPAMLLNIAVTGGLAYQNPVQLVELWWRTELMPRAVLLAEALSTEWLPRGHWVEFDPSQALRPDLATMTNTWSTLLADGVVSQEEYRAVVLDLPPLAAGDQAKELYEEAGAHSSAGVNGSGTLEGVVLS